MLTDKEQAWAEQMMMCIHSPCGKCTSTSCHDCYENYLYGAFNERKDLNPDWQDAAEFEARCKEYLSNTYIPNLPCFYGIPCLHEIDSCRYFRMEGKKATPFCRQIIAHIAVEEEMDQ